jgi:hypothetical protein
LIEESAALNVSTRVTQNYGWFQSDLVWYHTNVHTNTNIFLAVFKGHFILLFAEYSTVFVIIMPQYSWNTAKVGIKHQSIQSM